MASALHTRFTAIAANLDVLEARVSALTAVVTRVGGSLPVANLPPSALVSSSLPSSSTSSTSSSSSTSPSASSLPSSSAASPFSPSLELPGSELAPEDECKESETFVPAVIPYDHAAFLPGPGEPGVTETETRLTALAQVQGLRSVFHRVPSDYYSWRLEARRACLNAPSVHHLCKTIVMHNTKCPHDSFADRLNSKYYMVVVQYTARIHNERIITALRTALGSAAPSRKTFNFRLVSPETNLKLTGFAHNGVTPLGATERLPIILSHRIARLEHGAFWLGAGDVDLKWRVSIEDFLRVFDPIIANITHDDVVPDPDPTQ